MKKIYRNSFIYRLFFQYPLIIGKGEEGGKTYLERSVVFKHCLLFLEKSGIFFAQSGISWVIKRGRDYFARYGFRILGALFLSSSFYFFGYFFLFRFTVENFHFTLFEFVFYVYLFFLGFFFFILGNRLRGYYEASRLKKYFFSKEVPGR
ncbi:MAG: hypothetical protein AAB309_04175 [Deltaproteobacteria bacterium]